MAKLLRQLRVLEINAANVWKEAALHAFIGAPESVANPAASGAGVNPEPSGCRPNAPQ